MKKKIQNKSIEKKNSKKVAKTNTKTSKEKIKIAKDFLCVNTN